MTLLRKDKGGKIVMAYKLHLEDAWAKLDRGKALTAELRTEIEQAGTPNYREIALRREFDSESSCIIYRVAGRMEVLPHWGLLAGDAIHNFRCALDYLAWQFALRFYDGSIPDKEERNIYFPIVYDATKWSKNTKHMNPDDVSKIVVSQPFKFADQEGVAIPLDLLARLSNMDKHRKVNIVSNVLTKAHVVNDGWPNRDSMPRLNENGHMVLEHNFSGKEEVGEEVLRLHIIPTGPNPDVEINVRLFREIVFSQDDKIWPVIPALYYVGVVVEKILTRFDEGAQRPSTTIEHFPDMNVLQ